MFIGVQELVCLNISTFSDNILEEDETFLVNIEPDDNLVDVIVDDSALVTIYDTCK